jgi:hypothetical protein
MMSYEKTQKDVTSQQRMGEQSRLSTSPNGKVLSVCGHTKFLAEINATMLLLQQNHLTLEQWEKILHCR